jgi:hypothetical protein
MPTDASESRGDFDAGHLASLIRDDANLPRLGAPGGLTLDPAIDAHRSVLDELREELPFVDLENGAVRVVTINLDGVPVNVEVKPTVDSVTLTIVGAF